jgi:hypothetical protein
MAFRSFVNTNLPTGIKEIQMATFKSFLSAAGHDFVKVFTWLGSTQGQAAIAGTEAITNTVVTAENPLAGAALVGVEALVNNGLKQVLSMEAAAAAVGAQSGTGAQKAAAVSASLAPQVGALLTSIGVSNPTATQVQSLSTAVASGLASILNAIPAPVVA